MIELIHNSSLLQDDIFDSALLRRNKKTAHLIYGEKKAILTPVFLTSICGELIEEIGENVLFEYFYEMINDLTQGEILQSKISSETENEILLNNLALKTYFKTASLMDNGSKGIALICGQHELIDLFSQLGSSIGMFF